MLQFVEQYPALIVVILVLLIEWLLPLPEAYSPARACRALAFGFSKKLIKQQSASLLRLFGWFTLATYLIFIGIFIFTLLFIAPDDVWTQGLLLYFSLGYQASANQLTYVQLALSNQQKTSARAQLASLTEFDTSKLSPLGLNKLSLEILTSRFFTEWLMPLLLFTLSNGVVAFLFRAVVEAQKAWHPRRPRHQDFGQAVTACKNLIELLPTWLLAPIYSVFKSSPGWLKLYSSSNQAWRQSRVSSTNLLVWLSVVSAGSKCELAGPIMLEGNKFSRPRLNQGMPIDDKGMQILLSWNNRFRVFMLGFLIILLILLGVFVS